MKDRDWLIVILLAVIGWLLYQNGKKSQPAVQLIRGAPAMIQETKTTGILAVTLTIGSAPQQLPFGKPAFGCVTLTAPTTNTGIVYIANSEAGTRTGPRTTLVTGMPTDFHVSNIDSLYVFGTVPADTLAIFSEVQSGGN